MMIQMANGHSIDGDLIVDATLRDSLTPVPVTFEATIRLKESFANQLLEGMEVKVGRDQTPMVIKYVRDSISSVYQGGMVQIRYFIALHKNSEGISHRAVKGIFLENTTLSEIYKACGGKSEIGKDFAVPKFYCFKGETPSYLIARVCQEHGGVVRWMPEGDRLEFTRINDLFGQEPIMKLQTLADYTQKSGFLERHELPAYISCAPDGSIVKGNFDKDRNVEFMPHKTEAQLNSMTDVLLNAKEIPSQFAPDVHSGQLIDGGKIKFAIITAAHSFRQGAGNGGEESQSVFWTGVKQ
ncbi:hypothetical protein [Vitreoscilla stercoraria]|uniref:Uncharacterized protein n=1 Tax=Vitreoscilla stercoraria TaxID=61 RepID=A0ABY4EDD3_VITST|nr:hypothetical protein [Vitreoscilla stercoraria]UOO93425.1 hypothetical protein LVJ81_05185 [Vitreoscilla stercoraria]